jgi:hypothetical protein
MVPALPAAFLVELYEVSVRYKLPDMEFALYTGDQVGWEGCRHLAGPHGTKAPAA